MGFRPTIAATTAAALAMITLASCSSTEAADVAAPTTQSSTLTTEPPPAVAPSPLLAGLNPCDLLTPDEVAAATAVTGIEGRMPAVTSENVIGCEWGNGPGSASIVFLIANSDLGAANQRTYGETGGRPIKLQRGRHDGCTLTVRFGDDRHMSVSLAPTTESLKAQPEPLGELVCQRTLELTKTAISRLGWT